MLLFIGGRQAAEKARRAGHDILERGGRMMTQVGLGGFRETSIEVLGAETTYGPHARVGDTREVVLKISVHHDSREAVARFLREIPSLALGGPPGVSGGGSGLPRPSPLVRLECFPVERNRLAVSVEVGGEPIVFEDVVGAGESPSEDIETTEVYEGAAESIALLALAHGRSGDKGADVNIGVRSRHPDFYDVLRREVTAERVAGHLAHLGAAKVLRYALPGIHALNFLLVGGLGAGGTASLRFDPQGKAVAQQLLDMEIEVPETLASHPAMRSV
jgi:hypothetical protein